MNIAISGANGFIGSFLKSHFESQGHIVNSIKRISANTSEAEIENQLMNADVVINLAGAPILGRWTEAYKKQILESRINTTSALVRVIGKMDKKPSLFISTSAVGIYDTDGVNSEYNLRYANNFLATVCEKWEAEASAVAQSTRLIIFRLGVVLDAENGALKRMLPLFKFGFGGVIAGGKQGFPWIHVSDVIKAIDFVIGNPTASGVYNITAPEMIDNKQFTKTLASVLNRPAILPVPAFALKLLFGEASLTLTSGQFVEPARLLEGGFKFSFPNILPALQNLIFKK